MTTPEASAPSVSRGRMVKMSKRLSYVLRHHPEVAGIELDPHGWAPVNALMGAIGLSEAELEAVVAQNDKNRFEWDRARGRIRARQGHSVAADLGLEPVAAPPVLFHGTTTAALPAILAEGLRPMSRQFVHLSPSVGVAEDVAGRRGRGTSVILVVDAEAFVAAGHELFMSTNGVYLARSVPAEFLRVPPE